MLQTFFCYLYTWLILLVNDRDFRHRDLNNARLSASIIFYRSSRHDNALKVVPWVPGPFNCAIGECPDNIAASYIDWRIAWKMTGLKPTDG
jgi:hypothetical protein